MLPKSLYLYNHERQIDVGRPRSKFSENWNGLVAPNL
jgi:hypothetical protein